MRGADAVRRVTGGALRAVGLSALLVLAARAQAQGPSAAPDAAPLSASARATARGHAQDLAEVFRDACLQRRAVPDAVADWARAHGFATGTEAARQVADVVRQHGDRGQVFAAPDGRPVLLVATAVPASCLVMGLAAVDGPRLRNRAEALVADPGEVRFTAEPDRSADYTHNGLHRSLSWLGTAGAARYRMTVVSPVGVASGMAVLGLSVEPPAEAVR